MSKARFTTAKAEAICDKIFRNAKKLKHSEYSVPLFGDCGTLACDTHKALLLKDALYYTVQKPNKPEYKLICTLVQNASEECICEVTVPDLDDMKAYRKEHKDKTYDLGKYLPAVNVTYLIDLLTALPDARMFITGRPRDRFHRPLYLKSEHGEAILLPIMNTNKFDERREVMEKMGVA